MRRWMIASALIVVACLAACPSGACAVSTAPPAASNTGGSSLGADPGPPHVVLFLAPYLAWSDITPTATPTLWRFAGTGAVANMNTQVGGFAPGTSAEAGALTLSASRWSVDAPGAPAPIDRAEAAGRTFAIVGGSAVPSGTSAIVYPGISAAQSANSSSLSPPSLGLLGRYVHALDGIDIAIGNSDEPGGASGGLHRPAALAAMDERGLVDSGTVSANLLVPDGTMAFGVRTNRARFFGAIDGAVTATSGKPAFVVLDVGDLLRAHDAAATRSSTVTQLRYEEAVQLLDATVAHVAARDPRALLIVAAATESRDQWPRPALGPIIVARGNGKAGVLTSATTKRAGLVSNFDVATTVIAALGGPKSPGAVEQANGAVISAEPNSAAESEQQLSARVQTLGRANSSFLAIDSVLDAALNVWLALAVIALLLGVGTSLAEAPALRAVAELALLAVFSVPAGSTLASWLPAFPASAAIYIAALVGWSAAVFAACLAVRALLRWPSAPVAFLSGVSATFILAGQLFASRTPLGTTSLFGYSVLTGWRYYGISNEFSALALAFTLVAACIGTRNQRALVAGLVGAAAVLVLALPGAQAGAAVWGSVGVAVTCAAAIGPRPRPRNIAAGLSLAVLAAIALIALDALTGGTHLARLVGATASTGSGVLIQTIVRKAHDAFFFSVYSAYQLLASVAAGTLAWLWWGRKHAVRAVLERDPGVAPALLGIVVMGAVALVTEDSGISMPALMWGVAAFSAAYAVLATKTQSRALAADQSEG